MSDILLDVSGTSMLGTRTQPSMTAVFICCLVTMLTLLPQIRTVFADINRISIPSFPTSQPSSSSFTSSLAPSQFSSSSSTSSETTARIKKSSSELSLHVVHFHRTDNLNVIPLKNDHTSCRNSPAGESNFLHSSLPASQIQDSETTPANELAETKRASFKRIATDKEKKMLQAVEKLFLKNVGLHKRPKISTEFAVPVFMLDLYNMLSRRSGGPSGYIQLKGNGPKAANTVRSFLHTDIVSSSCKPPLCSCIHFDITSVPVDELITGAELRIFSNDTIDILTKTGDQTLTTPKQNQVSLRRQSEPLYRIEVHEIMQQVSPNADIISRLLDTRAVTRGNLTWHSFDIRPAVLRWRKGLTHNHGLEVRLVSRSPYLTVNNQVRITKHVHLTDREWENQRPLLVIYSDDISSGSSSSSNSTSSSSDLKTSSKLRRKKRQINVENRKDKKRTRENKKKKKKKRRRKKKGNKNICKRHSLYVDFNDVGWDDWIVAPAGYNAFYCHGDCMTPLPHFTKATSHAMLQARLYKVNPSLVPMVCCVPSKMSPISMLYRDEKGRTVLKNYRDMAVEECGCR